MIEPGCARLILFISDSISRFSSTIFFFCGQCATALVGRYLLMSLVSKCKYHYYQLLQITFSSLPVITFLLHDYICITSSILLDYYISISNISYYYNVITTILLHVITQLLLYYCLITVTLLHNYYIWTSITLYYYKFITTLLLPVIVILLRYYYLITVSLLPDY